MTDETALIAQQASYIPDFPMSGLAQEEIAQAAEEARERSTLTRYHEEKSAETLERQRYDLLLFSKFLESVYYQPGKLYDDLDAWKHINAGLIDSFVQWMKKQGYAVGSINVRLATVKAYCELARDVRVIGPAEYARIQGIKSIPHKKAVNIDKNRKGNTRRLREDGTAIKKANATDIPDEALPLLRFPDTGFLAKRDALLMCVLLDNGLRVGEVAILAKTQINLATGILTFDRPKVSLEAQKHELKENALRAAEAYMPTIPDEQESLFDLAVTSIQERVRLIGRLAGIENLSPHDCRHSAADRAARNGATLQELMQFGGWTNAQTAMRYLKRQEIGNKNIKV